MNVHCHMTSTHIAESAHTRNRAIVTRPFSLAEGWGLGTRLFFTGARLFSLAEGWGLGTRLDRYISLSVTEITQLAILFTPGSERRLKKSSYSAKFKINWCNLITSAPPTLLYSRSKIVSTSIAGSNHLTNARKPP